MKPRRRKYLDPLPPPPFDPQWAERRIEWEMADDNDEPPQCRLCACTDHSACEGGCSWVGEDLCSSCAELMDAFPMLLIADGYGIAAWNAAVRKQFARAADDAEVAWVCSVCDLLVVGSMHCPACDHEPPWGTGIDRDDGAPDDDVFEEYESERSIL